MTGQQVSQLTPGDVVLMKLDVFQGKRKVKDQWSEAEYMVVHQVADDVPVYKMMAGMLRLSTATDFSWWPPLEVMLHPWEEVSLLQKRVPSGLP